MPRGRPASAQTELVRLALEGIDAQIRVLQEKRAQFAKMAGSSCGCGCGRGTAPAARAAASVKANAAPPAKRKVSAATRRKLKEAAKRRWANQRTEKKAG
jgi:hypothetical protein